MHPEAEDGVAPRRPGPGHDSWLWPWSAALRMGAAALSSLDEALTSRAPTGAGAPEPAWTSPGRIRLDLPAVRVHEFAAGAGTPTVVVTPFALHGPVLADLAPRHSLIERLLAEGVGPLLLVECKSATADTRLLTIDDYLAALLVVVEEAGGGANLVGLCQGGWLSLMFAARFPSRVSRLVLAGAPVDLDAAPSKIVTTARSFPPDVVRAFVESDAGLVRGRTLQGSWSAHDLEQGAIGNVLQVEAPSAELLERYRAWHAWTLDLPGPYYVQVVEELFRANKLAEGCFVALGRRIDLAAVETPLYLLAAEDDEVTPPAQLLAAARLVGTAPDQVATALATGNHLSLFMGGRTLETAWREAAHWLRDDEGGERLRRQGPALRRSRA